MSIITSKEVAKAINLDKYGFIGTFLGWIILKILKISTINKIYNRNKHRSNLEFLDALLKEFKIRFEIPDEDLKRLPNEGAYITVSNHPLGGVDGILLLKLMIEQRSDFKIIANFLRSYSQRFSVAVIISCKFISIYFASIIRPICSNM